MRVLHLCGHLNAGGITSYIYTLASAMVLEGHEVLVVSSGGDQQQRFQEAGIKTLILPLKFKFMFHPVLWLQLWPLLRIIKSSHIDVLHPHTRVTQVLADVLRRWMKVAVITTCHGFFKPHGLRRWWSAWGNRVIAISAPVRQHLLKDFQLPEAQVVLIPNGIKIEDFVNPRVVINTQGLSRPVIGIIARLSWVKAIDVLIDAFVEVHQRYPQATLWIVGDGDQRSLLQQRVMDKGLAGQVRFEHSVGNTAAYLHQMDVFVMPSRMEGLGLSVIEAMASGIPVVATKVGGLVDLVKDQETGLLVEVDHPQQLAAKIMMMLDNPQQAAQMAANARRMVTEHFDAKQMVKQTLKVYEENISR